MSKPSLLHLTVSWVRGKLSTVQPSRAVSPSLTSTRRVTSTILSFIIILLFQIKYLLCCSNFSAPNVVIGVGIALKMSTSCFCLFNKILSLQHLDRRMENCFNLPPWLVKWIEKWIHLFIKTKLEERCSPNCYYCSSNIPVILPILIPGHILSRILSRPKVTAHFLVMMLHR